MLKKSEVCHCFLDVVCYCLEMNADFDQFQRKCFMLKPTNEIFVIETSGPTSWNILHVKFLACCQKFVEFRINLFSNDGMFPLKKANRDYTWARRDYKSDVDFDCNNNFFEIHCNNVSHYDSGDDDDKQVLFLLKVLSPLFTILKWELIWKILPELQRYF